MSERREQFPVGERPGIEVMLPSGSLRVVAGSPGAVAVEVRGAEANRFDISESGDGVRVRLDGGRGGRWRSHDVVVAVPPGATMQVRVASAEVSVETDLGALDVQSSSGRVSAQDVAGDVTVKSASGDVRLGAAGGDVRVSSASGDFALASSGGAVTTNTAAGDVRIGRVDGALSVRSASGDVTVDSYGGHDLDCATVSGDVSIGIVPGRTVDLDLFTLAGDVTSAFAAGDGDGDGGSGGGGGAGGEPGRVSVRSTAGDISLRRAPAG